MMLMIGKTLLMMMMMMMMMTTIMTIRTTIMTMLLMMMTMTIMMTIVLIMMMVMMMMMTMMMIGSRKIKYMNGWCEAYFGEKSRLPVESVGLGYLRLRLSSEIKIFVCRDELILGFVIRTEPSG